MSRFEEANNRLLTALERLERAATRGAAGDDSGSGAPAGGATGPAADPASNGELENLRGSLDASRRANAALRASRDAVATRLDDAIDRLKTVLGE